MKFSDEALRIVAEALPGTTIGEDGTRYINFDKMEIVVGDLGSLAFKFSLGTTELMELHASARVGDTVTLIGFQFRTPFKIG